MYLWTKQTFVKVIALVRSTVYLYNDRSIHCESRYLGVNFFDNVMRIKHNNITSHKNSDSLNCHFECTYY